MIKLRGHHLLVLIEHHRSCFSRLEEVMIRKVKIDGRTRFYDDATITRTLKFAKDLIANPEQEFQVVAEPDSICKLCCNYDLKIPSGCKEFSEPEDPFVFGEDYEALARLGVLILDGFQEV